MNYEMYLWYLEKSHTPEDMAFWKREYLKQLADKVKDTEREIIRGERDIIRERENIKKNKKQIKDLKKHIKKVENTQVN
jgi:septal ring factor EnvC (AmiA/AmiB activator)